MKVGASKGCQVLVRGFCSVTLTHRGFPRGQGLWSVWVLGTASPGLQLGPGTTMTLQDLALAATNTL